MRKYELNRQKQLLASKTDEKSKDFKDFKVRGFPSYMVKDGRNIAPINVGDRSEQSIIDAVKELP